MTNPSTGAAVPQGALSAWAERRPKRTAADRKAIAKTYSQHLPEPEELVMFTHADLKALKAAFIQRFDEDLPRTETLMAVAMIGYRMALLSARGGPK